MAADGTAGMFSVLASFTWILTVRCVDQVQPRVRRMHPSRIDASALFKCIRSLLMHPGCIRCAVSRHLLTDIGRRIVQWFVHFLVNNIFILLTMSFLSPSYIGPFVLRHFVGLVLLLRPLHAHLTPISLLTSCTPPRYLILLSYPVRFSLSYPTPVI